MLFNQLNLDVIIVLLDVDHIGFGDTFDAAYKMADSTNDPLVPIYQEYSVPAETVNNMTRKQLLPVGLEIYHAEETLKNYYRRINQPGSKQEQTAYEDGFKAGLKEQIENLPGVPGPSEA